MVEQQSIVMLDIDYRKATQAGWDFTGNKAEAFTSRKKALEYAESILSPDYQTGIVKGIACGLVLWSVGVKEPS